MCPLSDDALLDWALAPDEADPAVARHVRDCASCGARARAATREQDLLRDAFAAPARPAAPLPVPWWPRVGIAALLLITVAVGVLLTRTADSPREGRFRHAALAPIQSDLDRMAREIAAARETLPESATAYLDLLSREEDLYVDGLEHYVHERSPLSAGQVRELRRTLLQNFSSSEVREKLGAFLNPEQQIAFEEYSRQGVEWQRRKGISLLVDDLSEELDLRFSEAEKVRLALETNYPLAEHPVLRADRCPPDPLVENPVLSGAVRNSLDARYRLKFDTYLGQVRTARERALKIARPARSSR